MKSITFRLLMLIMAFAVLSSMVCCTVFKPSKKNGCGDYQTWEAKTKFRG